MKYSEVLSSFEKGKPVALSHSDRLNFLVEGRGIETLFNWDLAARKIAANGFKNATVVERWKSDQFKIDRSSVVIFEEGNPVLRFNFNEVGFGGMDCWYVLKIDGEEFDCTILGIEEPSRWRRTHWPKSALEMLLKPVLKPV